MPKKKSPQTPTQIYQLHISLLEYSPLIWRRILVPSSTKLPDLHKILQTVMGWTNSHLHNFIYNDISYEDPELNEFESPFVDYSKISLNSLLKIQGASMLYNYDYGDDWQHKILLEAILVPDPDRAYPRCVDGQLACPPEDVGGVPGYENFLEILSNTKHPEFKETIQWIGPDFDPKDFDLDEINELLLTENFGCFTLD